MMGEEHVRRTIEPLLLELVPGDRYAATGLRLLTHSTRSIWFETTNAAGRRLKMRCQVVPEGFN